MGSRQPMRLSYSEFQVLKVETDAVFAAWKAGYKKFDELFLQLWKTRVRSQPGVSGSQVLKNLNANFEHLRIQQRIEEIAAFRAQHERFCQVSCMKTEFTSLPLVLILHSAFLSQSGGGVSAGR